VAPGVNQTLVTHPPPPNTTLRVPHTLERNFPMWLSSSSLPAVAASGPVVAQNRSATAIIEQGRGGLMLIAQSACPARARGMGRRGAVGKRAFSPWGVGIYCRWRTWVGLWAGGGRSRKKKKNKPAFLIFKGVERGHLVVP